MWNTCSTSPKTSVLASAITLDNTAIFGGWGYSLYSTLKQWITTSVPSLSKVSNNYFEFFEILKQSIPDGTVASIRPQELYQNSFTFCNYFVNKMNNSFVEQYFQPAINRNMYGFLCNLGIGYILAKFVCFPMNGNWILLKHYKYETTISIYSFFKYVVEHTSESNKPSSLTITLKFNCLQIIITLSAALSACDIHIYHAINLN